MRAYEHMSNTHIHTHTLADTKLGGQGRSEYVQNTLYKIFKEVMKIRKNMLPCTR